MLDKMKTLLRESSMCVLATCSDNTPHSSLMTYVTNEQAETVYTATLSSSRKYRNIVQNPRVSFLVDTRMNDGDKAGSIKALTVSGTASILTGKSEKDSILTRIRQAHPHLEDLLLRPDAEVIAIEVESFLLLEGPTQARFMEIQKQG